MSKKTLEYLERFIRKQAITAAMEEYHHIKNKMELMMHEKTQSLMFKSKAQWHMEGEYSSKYFFSLAKSNYNKKTCSKWRQQVLK